MSRLYTVDPEADIVLLVPPAQPGRGDGKSGASVPAGKAVQAGLKLAVSSRHLSLASRRFRDRLAGYSSFEDGSQTDGRLQITLEGSDPTAVTIIMNIIHSRGRRTPKEITLETLAQVALFVDRYGCHEAVEIYVDRWIERLETSLPGSYGRDLTQWIFVSFVFRRAELFRAATHAAAIQSTGPIEELGLPIREKIIRSIDGLRTSTIQRAVTLLAKTVNDLGDDKVPCSEGCDALLLGTIIKALRRHKISVDVLAPYQGISLSQITQVVAEVQSQMNTESGAKWRPSTRKTPALAQQQHQQPTPDASPELRPQEATAHECLARGLMGPKFDALLAGIEGLALESDLGYYLY